MSETLAPPRPAKADELVNTGVRLFHGGNHDPARLHFLAALSLEPKNPIALQNLGAVLRDMNHYHASLAVAKRSVALSDDKNPYRLTNLGVALFCLKRNAEALTCIKEAAELLPNDAPPWQNLGLIHYAMGRYQDALECFDKSLGLQYAPTTASDRSLALLSLGHIADGLAFYECRWDIMFKSRIWTLKIPEWKGEDVRDRRVLLHHEQGFGDSIMLVRFVRKFIDLRCDVTIAVPQPLVRLFKKNFSVPVVSIDDPTLTEDSSFDYHSPMLSAMRHLGIHRPDDIDPSPYLTHIGPSPMKLPRNKKKIGICWASGNHGPVLRDRRRLVPLHLFLPLLDDVDVGLISLQKGDDTKDIINYGLEGLVFDLSTRLEDFAHTANVIAELDLVISVDSAVCHLAGAMGKPVLMLSPYTRCWRWWGLPSGHPWYRRMVIIAQSADGTWDAAMKQVVSRALWILKEGREIGGKTYAVG